MCAPFQYNTGGDVFLRVVVLVVGVGVGGVGASERTKLDIF